MTHKQFCKRLRLLVLVPTLTAILFCVGCVTGGGFLDFDLGGSKARTEIICDDNGENCETVVYLLGEDGGWHIVARKDVD